MVSVIVPFNERYNLLEETINSVLRQNYKEFELILINDNIDSRIPNKIYTLVESDNRIHLITRKTMPSGASACRNLGLKFSLGRYIVFLDSDDLLENFCLEVRVKKMEQSPDLDFAVFPMLFFYRTAGDTTTLWNIQTEENDLDRFLRLDAVWQTTGPIWCKEVLERLGGFNEQLNCWQDIDIHLKALFSGLKYKVFNHYRPDCFYRKVSKDTISQSNINSLEKLESRLTLCHWVLDNLGSNINRAKPMAIKIGLSAIRGGQYKFAWNFIHEMNRVFTMAEVQKLVKALFLHSIPFTRKFAHKKIIQKELGKLPPVTIGQHNLNPKEVISAT
ncbi:MAG: glycosyltransferase family A protein [Bacteroidota bacterium]